MPRLAIIDEPGLPRPPRGSLLVRRRPPSTPMPPPPLGLSIPGSKAPGPGPKAGSVEPGIGPRFGNSMMALRCGELESCWAQTGTDAVHHNAMPSQQSHLAGRRVPWIRTPIEDRRSDQVVTIAWGGCPRSLHHVIRRYDRIDRASRCRFPSRLGRAKGPLGCPHCASCRRCVVGSQILCPAGRVARAVHLLARAADRDPIGGCHRIVDHRLTHGPLAHDSSRSLRGPEFLYAHPAVADELAVIILR